MSVADCRPESRCLLSTSGPSFRVIQIQFAQLLSLCSAALAAGLAIAASFGRDDRRVFELADCRRYVGRQEGLETGSGLMSERGRVSRAPYELSVPRNCTRDEGVALRVQLMPGLRPVKSPASRRGRAKSRETRTLRWRKRDSNRWSHISNGGSFETARSTLGALLLRQKWGGSLTRGTDGSNPIRSSAFSSGLRGRIPSST